MKQRDELAEQILVGLCAGPDDWEDKALVRKAYHLADMCRDQRRHPPPRVEDSGMVRMSNGGYVRELSAPLPPEREGPPPHWSDNLIFWFAGLVLIGGVIFMLYVLYTLITRTFLS